MADRCVDEVAIGDLEAALQASGLKSDGWCVACGDLVHRLTPGGPLRANMQACWVIGPGLASFEQANRSLAGLLRLASLVERIVEKGGV